MQKDKTEVISLEYATDSKFNTPLKNFYLFKYAKLMSPSIYYCYSHPHE